MRRRNIASETGFLRSPKQLQQMLSWVLIRQLSFSIRIFGKMSFSENFMLLSNLNRMLNSFQKWFLGSTLNVELENAKSSSLRTPNLFRKYLFVSCNKSLLVFQCGFNFGHQMFSRVQRSKTIFLELNFRRNDLFRKYFCVWHCSMNVYLFSCIVFGLSETFYRKFSWLGVKTSFSMRFCEGTSFLEANFFSIPRRTLFFFQKTFLRMPKAWHHMFKRVRRSENIFRC